MATLSQLLAHPDLRLRLIQAGPRDPEISWSSTTELLDLSEHLEGSEIILTTGLALTFEDPRWRDFVAALSRARVAAIGFGVGVTHDAIPPRLVRAASTYQVALFEVPPPVPFIAVSKAIAQLLQADELRAARQALRVQQRLLDGAHGDREPAEVLASIAQATGKQLALLASDGSVLASTAGYGAACADPEGAIEHIALDPDRALRLAVAGEAQLTPEGRAVIAAGSMVLGLGLRGGRIEGERERERWERLTQALLSGRAAASSVEILAPERELPSRVRVVVLQGQAEDIGEWRRRPRSGAERLVTPSPEPGGAHGLVNAWQLVEDAEPALQRALSVAAAHNLDAVIGRPSPLADAPLSRRSATTRLHRLSPAGPLYATPRTPAVVWADRDSPLLEALLARPADERRALSSRVLGPLSRHRGAGDGGSDAGSDAALLRDTLVAVSHSNGQRGPAAAALGIHRNTLRDRIGRIEDLTGRSLADPDDRAELWLALRLEQIDAF